MVELCINSPNVFSGNFLINKCQKKKQGTVFWKFVSGLSQKEELLVKFPQLHSGQEFVKDWLVGRENVIVICHGLMGGYIPLYSVGWGIVANSGDSRINEK